jgi:hypothetical protein
MKITHRALADASAPISFVAEPVLGLAIPAGSLLGKAPRMSCCCRISELLPLVRQLHDAARAAQQPGAQPSVAA